MLKNLLAIVAWLLGLLPRWLKPKSVDERTYQAKVAEAKELAKPDVSQSDVVSRL